MARSTNAVGRPRENLENPVCHRPFLASQRGAATQQRAHLEGGNLLPQIDRHGKFPHSALKGPRTHDGRAAKHDRAAPIGFCACRGDENLIFLRYILHVSRVLSCLNGRRETTKDWLMSALALRGPRYLPKTLTAQESKARMLEGCVSILLRRQSESWKVGVSAARVWNSESEMAFLSAAQGI